MLGIKKSTLHLTKYLNLFPHRDDWNLVAFRGKLQLASRFKTPTMPSLVLDVAEFLINNPRSSWRKDELIARNSHVISNQKLHYKTLRYARGEGD
ncbi:hypothetical protein LYNGBM3L_39290 [Moorena producens 3L]|uniref:Uncharacterized protein n=1 Tax=Moorena producens 3L TaxID=489825 RepID=F4XVG7_9CYAN|nr:hypothetical protein LYNGBM3L_39290 [Moorena producens 3L]OLT68681.1 hypothetical protein BI334_30015 [Moorena producens 3L]